MERLCHVFEHHTWNPALIAIFFGSLLVTGGDVVGVRAAREPRVSEGGVRAPTCRSVRGSLRGSSAGDWPAGQAWPGSLVMSARADPSRFISPAVLPEGVSGCVTRAV